MIFILLGPIIAHAFCQAFACVAASALAAPPAPSSHPPLPSTRHSHGDHTAHEAGFKRALTCSLALAGGCTHNYRAAAQSPQRRLPGGRVRELQEPLGLRLHRGFAALPTRRREVGTARHWARRDHHHVRTVKPECLALATRLLLDAAGEPPVFQQRRPLALGGHHPKSHLQ